MTQQDPFSSARQFLSGGLTTAKWPSIGYVVEGTVTGSVLRQQTDYDTNALLFWNDGNPRMQLVVDMQCAPTGETWAGLHNTRKALPNDDGMRAAYVKGNLQRALVKGLRDAGNAQFEHGARLRIERIADVPNPDPKKAPAHDYAVTWIPAAANTSPAEGFLNAPEADPALAAAPQAYQAPTPQAPPMAPAPQYQAPPMAPAPAAPVSGPPF